MANLDPLEGLAERVADGERVDWSAAESDGDSRTRRVLRHLRTVSELAAVHREPEPGDQPRYWRHLQLLAHVGRGSFGEVYRAWDPQLDREVALKLLFAGDRPSAEALAEARLLARVRHPNVVTIFGADEVDGRVGIWMEFVNGRTLAEVVRGEGPLDADNVRLTGLAVCRAVAAVHRAGIIHRDIKAHNIVREDSGRIVLMDFGAGTDPLGGTGGSRRTGTPLYLAPEVLCGGPANVRSDVYAVGVLMYFLASGAYPVEGADAAEIERKHKTQGCRRLRDVVPAAPQDLANVISRAIAPAAEQRYPTASAMESALLRGFEQPAETRSRRPARRVAGLAVAAAALLALAAGFGAGRWSTPAAPAANPARFALWPDAGETFDNIAVAPDGRRLVYSMAGSLWVRGVDELDARRLPDTAGGHTPFWSPDGRTIAYFAGVDLKKIALEGGAPVTLCRARRPRGGTWGADGTIVFSVNLGVELQRVSADGGEPAVLRRITEGRAVAMRWPQFLPGGRRFIYSLRSEDAVVQGVYLASLDDASGSLDQRLAGTQSNAIAVDGTLLFVERGILTAQPFDAESASTTGPRVPVAARVDQEPLDDGFATFSAAHGMIAFRGGRNPNRQLRWYDRQGALIGAATPPGEFRTIALSPDGRQIAYEILESEHGTRDIWVTEVATGATRRLTFDDADEGSPIWSPDASTIVYASNRGSRVAIYQRPSSGAGPEALVTERQALPGGWSSDGRTLVLELVDQMRGWDIWLYSLEDGQASAFIETNSMERDAQLSPDGRWLAYSSSESGQREVYVEPIPRDGRRWQVSNDYGRQPTWRADGRELYFLARRETLMRTDVRSTGRDLSFGERAPMFRLRVAGGDLRYHYQPSPDGQRFLVNTLVEDARSAPIIVYAGWRP